jgi:hypothetical protein
MDLQIDTGVKRDFSMYVILQRLVVNGFRKSQKWCRSAGPARDDLPFLGPKTLLSMCYVRSRTALWMNFAEPWVFRTSGDDTLRRAIRRRVRALAPR